MQRDREWNPDRGDEDERQQRHRQRRRRAVDQLPGPESGEPADPDRDHEVEDPQNVEPYQRFPARMAAMQQRLVAPGLLAALDPSPQPVA